jgi:chromosome partitioning protein
LKPCARCVPTSIRVWKSKACCAPCINAQSTLTQQVSSELENHFGNKVYKTIVPRNVRLAEAPSYGKPVIAFDKNSKGAQAYSALAKEILERVAQ